MNGGLNTNINNLTNHLIMGLLHIYYNIYFYAEFIKNLSVLTDNSHTLATLGVEFLVTVVLGIVTIEVTSFLQL